MAEKTRGIVTYVHLKARHRAEREAFPKALSLRVHRALSWLSRAEQLAEQDDPDGQFIFLWIAFNAAYATEIDERYRTSAQVTSRAFLRRLAELDAPHGRLDAMVWQEFSASLRTLLDNPYVHKAFWDWQNGLIDEDDWKQSFTRAKRAATQALARQNTVTRISTSSPLTISRTSSCVLLLTCFIA